MNKCVCCGNRTSSVKQHTRLKGEHTASWTEWHFGSVHGFSTFCVLDVLGSIIGRKASGKPTSLLSVSDSVNYSILPAEAFRTFPTQVLFVSFRNKILNTNGAGFDSH
jgi:hypothetical protein